MVDKREENINMVPTGEMIVMIDVGVSRRGKAIRPKPKSQVWMRKVICKFSMLGQIVFESCSALTLYWKGIYILLWRRWFWTGLEEHMLCLKHSALTMVKNFEEPFLIDDLDRVRALNVQAAQRYWFQCYTVSTRGARGCCETPWTGSVRMQSFRATWTISLEPGSRIRRCVRLQGSLTHARVNKVPWDVQNNGFVYVTAFSLWES